MGDSTNSEILVLENLKPNSKSYREEQKKALDKQNIKKDSSDKPDKMDKVIAGKASVKKAGVGKKMEDALLADDAKNVKSYLIWDVLIPAIKDTLSDLVKKGIDALLFGEERRSSNGSVKRNGNSSYVSYASYYDRSSPNIKSDRYRRDRRSRNRSRSFDDIIYERRSDAEEVLENLVELTVMYGMASVADLLELSGMETTYMDNQFGWDQLSDATVRRVRDGYILDLPRPEKLDDME